jgi:anion-transporting  ArsA/GET3 family ATPase
MLDELLDRRVIFLLGKGGVGRTSIAAALALHCAQTGRRVLAMECDLRGPLASRLGCEPAFEPREAQLKLAAMILDGRHSLEEYLRLIVPGRAVLNAVFASRLYQYFVQAAPGLRELMMLGKVCYEVERNLSESNSWDMIIVDAPASGQAIQMLRMPFAANQIFGESVVGRESRNIARMLRNKRLCALVLVTSADSLALPEALEGDSALRALGLELDAVILNRYAVTRFSRADVDRFGHHGRLRSSLKRIDDLCSIAAAELERAARSQRALSLLKQRMKCPVVTIRECAGRFGSELVRDLAAQPSMMAESEQPVADRVATSS